MWRVTGENSGDDDLSDLEDFTTQINPLDDAQGYSDSPGPSTSASPLPPSYINQSPPSSLNSNDNPTASPPSTACALVYSSMLLSISYEVTIKCLMTV